MVVIDKNTGYANKRTPNGEIVPLTDEEKNRLAHIIIEICLHIYARHVKNLSKSMLDEQRNKIKRHLGGDDTAL